MESQVVASEAEIVPYGGQPQPFKSWERDMSLREAIRISNVPVYQEVARRVGRSRYQHYLKELSFGNMQVGNDITRFWLDGPLEISALEHVQFLTKLAQISLPLSDKTQETVRDILKRQTIGTAVLFGKTGWTNTPTPDIGWFVGWVEDGDNLYVFALNIDIHSNEDARLREQLSYEILEELGVF